MQFQTFSEFLAMGHHGLYVWLAYGATTLILIAYPLVIAARSRRLLNELSWQQANQTKEQE